MPHEISSAASLDQLKKRAKQWLKELRSQDAEARARFEGAYPTGPANPVLRDVQHALASEYGFESWIALRAAVEKPVAHSAPGAWPTLTNDQYERLASDLLHTFNDRDEKALQRLNDHYRRAFTFDDLWAETWRRVYAFRQRSLAGSKNRLQPAEAQGLIAQDAGFGSWKSLTRAQESGPRRVPAYAIDDKENRIAPRRQLSDAEWDELIGVMKERRIPSLDANGLMTDAVLARVAQLDHVTSLSLGGSRQLTDDGLLSLARMTQLERLNLDEYPGGKLTDRGLQVLRDLPNLRVFEMTWQRGVSDAGVENLRHCPRLERVNLMGSPTGDGAIAALQGKPALRQFNSGKLVTDAGLKLLRGFPRLKQEPVRNEGEDPDNYLRDQGAFLLIDGPFSDAGLAGLAGLAGVVDLDLFWHVKRITGAGFAHLADLPNLRALGADGALSDDVAMRHIGAMPKLRRLRAQESVASDEGFEALARSRTLEHLWGRVCPSFSSRGFVALSKVPTLRSLGIGCKNVDDTALAKLPDFPALRELTPIDVTDDGFRHIGRCRRVERLTCMYCRDTTDRATEQIAHLQLRYYYAGLTQITDRSLEVLGGMRSLEQVELYECVGPTDAGLAFLANLPRLQEVSLHGCPGVTLEGTRALPEHVRVNYST